MHWVVLNIGAHTWSSSATTQYIGIYQQKSIHRAGYLSSYTRVKQINNLLQNSQKICWDSFKDILINVTHRPISVHSSPYFKALIKECWLKERYLVHDQPKVTDILVLKPLRVFIYVQVCWLYLGRFTDHH